ncbi:unnamed protein product [Haemonchus placei]|uniref:Uncharacterized protein n=1 Tax=Haemonchus placei TaxID=6290 RepID=A0A3P7VUJ7_HAEPC|nr:unnamed protein product [Haemonchus placei]
MLEVKSTGHIFECVLFIEEKYKSNTIKKFILHQPFEDIDRFVFEMTRIEGIIT